MSWRAKKGDRRLVQSKSNIACGFLSFLRQWAATRSLSCNRADSCTGAFSFSSLGVLQSSLCSLPLCFKSMPLEIHFTSLFKPRRCHIERIIFLLSCFHWVLDNKMSTAYCAVCYHWVFIESLLLLSLGKQSNKMSTLLTQQWTVHPTVGLDLACRPISIRSHN